MNTMSLFNIKKIAVVSAAAVMFFVVGSGEANAQSRREMERERQRIERQQQRQAERQRPRGGSYNRMIERAHQVNYDQGYQYGFQAGQFDRRKRKYNQSNVYRNTGSAPNAGGPSSADYAYRQGYLQGYNDGYNGGRTY